MQNEDLNVEQWLSVSSGTFALLGVALGNAMTMIAASFANKRRKNAMLLAKLDEAMDAFESARNWVIGISKETSFRSAHSSPLSGCGRLQALTLLYFREMEPPVSAYIEALQKYYVWLMGCLSHLGPNGNLEMPLDVWLGMDERLSVEWRRHTRIIQECQQNVASAMKSKADSLLAKS